MSYQFRIDRSAFQQDGILYLEDATSKNSQFHAVNLSLEEGENRVRMSISKLGGAVVQFIPVIFEQPERYGYLIEYVFKGGAFGQMPIAGLPIRTKKHTQYFPKKVEQARKQALYVAAQMFDSAYNSMRHMPLSNPLLMHLLVDGQKTIAQMIAERQELPEQFLLPEVTK